jgi:hypothetical protein
VNRAYEEQIARSRKAGRAHHPDGLRARWQNSAAIADDYAKVYNRVLSQVREP